MAGLDLSSSGWKGKERFEYGLGVGGGLNIWRLQIVARYNWNFGSLYNVQGWDDIVPNLKGMSVMNENFGGVSLSMSYFF